MSDMPESLAMLFAQMNQKQADPSRRYKTMRSYLNFRAREKNIPISGCFELTPLCNLDCKMCYVHLNKKQLGNSKLLDVDTWKKIIKQAVDAGMMYARVTGGECLTYPGFREIYLYLREFGIETTVLTNGILANKEMAEFWEKYPPATVQITLYGASDDAYEKVTGHRAFSVVAENIKRLQSLSLPVLITATPNAYMDDGEQIVRFVHSLGLPLAINSGLMAPREETGRDNPVPCIDQYISMVKMKNKLYGGDPFEACDENELPDPSTDRESRFGVTCGAGRSNFSISWCGEMRPCNTFPEISADVLSKGFAQGWKHINSEVKQFPLPAECTACKYRSKCKHCVAEHAANAPIGHASPAICAWARRLAAEGIIKI